MGKLVSVIIPVYNAEKTIGLLLSDMIAQTYNNIEVICVDDGSTDQSAELIREFCKNYESIKLIQTSNFGVSHARNMGIEVAKGDYLRFLDSDDRIETDSIDRMVHVMEQDVDLIIAKIEIVRDSVKTVEDFHLDGKKDISDMCRHFARYPKSFFYGSVCNKLYRTDIIREHQIRFLEDVFFCEDYLFNLVYYSKVKQVYYLDEVHYTYIKKSDSLTTNLDKHNQHKVYEIECLREKKGREFAEAYGASEEFTQNWYFQSFRGCMLRLTKNSTVPLKERYHAYLAYFQVRDIEEFLRYMKKNGLFYKNLYICYRLKILFPFFVGLVLRGRIVELIKKGKRV